MESVMSTLRPWHVSMPKALLDRIQSEGLVFRVLEQKIGILHPCASLELVRLRSDHDHCALCEYAWLARCIHQSILCLNMHSEAWLSCKKRTLWQTVWNTVACFQSRVQKQPHHFNSVFKKVTRGSSANSSSSYMPWSVRAHLKSFIEGRHHSQNQPQQSSHSHHSFPSIFSSVNSTAAAETVSHWDAVTAVCQISHASLSLLSAARATTTFYKFPNLPAMTRLSDPIGN